MAILSAAEIDAVNDAVTETVPVPEWGGEVIIRGMTGTERDFFEAGMFKGGKLDRRNYRSKLLAKVLVNENGTRIYTDDAGAARLGKRNAGVIDRLYDIAAGLSGLADDDQEEMEGNSESEETTETETEGAETEDGSASPSTSPAPSDETAPNS
jgi:hypothetical protein